MVASRSPVEYKCVFEELTFLIQVQCHVRVGGELIKLRSDNYFCRCAIHQSSGFDPDLLETYEFGVILKHVSCQQISKLCFSDPETLGNRRISNSR